MLGVRLLGGAFCGCVFVCGCRVFRWVLVVIAGCFVVGEGSRIWFVVVLGECRVRGGGPFLMIFLGGVGAGGGRGVVT